MTVIPTNTEITTNLPNEITIKEENETIKMLGIYFNEDLQHANELNYEIMIKLINGKT